MKAVEAGFSNKQLPNFDNELRLDLPQNHHQVRYDGSFPLPIQRKGFYIYTSTPRAMMDQKKPFRIGRNSQNV